MSTLIMDLLNNNDLTIDDIAEVSGFSQSVLQEATKKPVEEWSIKVLNAFAKGLRKEPSELLDILQLDEYSLEIDDEAQTIQDVHIADKHTFLDIKHKIEMQYEEGWKPEKDDVEYLLSIADNSDHK